MLSSDEVVLEATSVEDDDSDVEHMSPSQCSVVIVDSGILSDGAMLELADCVIEVEHSLQNSVAVMPELVSLFDEYEIDFVFVG